jgi:hypothetical protein
MIDSIQSTIAEIRQAQFRDRRLHHAEVQVTGLQENRANLAGSVLDTNTHTILLRELQHRYPQLTIDGGQLKILRREPPQLATVATNLTGLRGEPSSGAELLSEVLSGWRLERLSEQDKWTFVRQSDGYLGWVYTPYLVNEAPGEPTDIVVEP